MRIRPAAQRRCSSCRSGSCGARVPAPTSSTCGRAIGWWWLGLGDTTPPPPLPAQQLLRAAVHASNLPCRVTRLLLASGSGSNNRVLSSLPTGLDRTPARSPTCPGTGKRPAISCESAILHPLRSIICDSWKRRGSLSGATRCRRGPSRWWLARPSARPRPGRGARGWVGSRSITAPPGHFFELVAAVVVRTRRVLHPSMKFHRPIAGLIAPLGIQTVLCVW